MGWGSAFSAALGTVSAKTKSAVQSAVQTVNTAWDHTKQKAGEAVEKASAWGEQKLEQGQQKAQQAQEWAAENYDSSKKYATEQYNKGAAAVQHTAKHAGEATKSAVNTAFDKIDQNFSPQRAGCATGNCPANNADPNKPPPPRGSGQSIPPPPCLLSPVTVTCGHESRNFTLIPPSTPTNNSFDQVIQVIHDEHLGEKVTVTFACGTCPDGNGPDQPRLDLGNQSTKATRLFVLEGPTVEISQNWQKRVPFWDFAKHFWGPPGYGDHIPYHGRVVCCRAGGKHDFEVQVFPRREFNFTVTGVFEVEDEKNIFGRRTGHETHAFKLGGSVHAIYAQKDLSIELPTFNGIKVVMEKLADRLHAMPKGDIFSLNYRLPDIEIKGGARSIEIQGRYNIAWQGYIGVKFEPLVGIEGQVDLIQAILLGVFKVPSPLRKTIKMIREEAEEGYDGKNFGAKAVCNLDFIASGGIHGEATWTYDAFSGNAVEGAISADLDLKVEGEISGEMRVWRVSYTAGATIKAATGLAFVLKGIFVGDEPGFDGVIEFKGLIIEALAYVSVGGTDVGTDNNGTDAINDRKEDKDKGGWDRKVGFKDETEWEIVVFEPVTFFKEPTLADNVEK